MDNILSSLGPIFTVGLVFILLVIFLSFVPLGLWITAFFGSKSWNHNSCWNEIKKSSTEKNYKSND